MPSHYEYALMSALAYYRHPRIQLKQNSENTDPFRAYTDKLMELGWTPLPTSVEELRFDSHPFYFGIAYYKINHKESEAEIIIAHRGIQFDDIGNLFADMALAETHNPKIFNSALDYSSRLLTDFSFKYPFCYKQSISHTGFSLGGALAIACATFQDPRNTAIVFDAPASTCINNLPYFHKKLCINYITEPNLINTCGGHHLAELRKLDIPLRFSRTELQSCDFDLEAFALVSPALSSQSSTDTTTMNHALLMINRTLDSHHLFKIVEAMQNPQECLIVQNWPRAQNTFTYGQEQSQILPSAPTLGKAILRQLKALIDPPPSVSHSPLWRATYKVEGGKLVGLLKIHHQIPPTLRIQAQSLPTIPLQQRAWSHEDSREDTELRPIRR